jgi:hypothetical protein
MRSQIIENLVETIPDSGIMDFTAGKVYGPTGGKVFENLAPVSELDACLSRNFNHGKEV